MIKRIKKYYIQGDPSKPAYGITYNNYLDFKDCHISVRIFEGVVEIKGNDKKIIDIYSFIKNIPFNERIQKIENINKSLKYIMKFKL